MEGMDIKAVATSMILTIANIVILFIIVRALVYKPVKRYMKTRSDAIQAQTDEAAKRLMEAEALVEERDTKLAMAEKEATEIKNGIIAAADRQAEEIRQEALAEANKIKLQASKEAQRESEYLLQEMKEKIADMAVEIAQQVLEREVKKSDNQDIIDSFFDKVK